MVHSARPQQLRSPRLDTETGTLSFYWVDSDDEEVPLDWELNEIIGIAGGVVTAPSSGFFTDNLVRNIHLGSDPPGSCTMVYEAAPRLGSHDINQYSFDLSKLFVIDRGEIDIKTDRELRNTISSRSTRFLRRVDENSTGTRGGRQSKRPRP